MPLFCRHSAHRLLRGPHDASAAGVGAEGVRLDLWLWAARFFKTRALAKKAIELGQVRLDEQTLKPSRSVRGASPNCSRSCCADDSASQMILADQRGPASAAQQLYVESETSIAARMAEREKRRFEAQGYQPPETRPNKRQRRLIQALGDLDTL